MKVGLVQINNSFSGQNYLPYSVALLQAYVEKHAPGKHTFLPLIYKRAAIDSIVQSLVTADLVGFSIYVWNERISLEIARRLRLLNSKIITVFGGPQVPDKALPFIEANPQVDIVVHNEGERAFPRHLEWPRKLSQTMRAGSAERYRRYTISLPRRHLRFPDRREPQREMDWPLGNQSRLSVQMYILSCRSDVSRYT